MTRHGRVRMAVGVVVAALAVGTIAVGVAYAQQGAKGDQQGMRGRGAMMGRGMMLGNGRGMAALRMGLARLDLTDQQKQQVKTIVQGHREQVQGFAKQGVQARVALREAVASGADEATIRARAADLAKVEADLAVFGSQLRKQILGVLTPEQQAKAKDLRLRALDRAAGRRKDWPE